MQFSIKFTNPILLILLEKMPLGSTNPIEWLKWFIWPFDLVIRFQCLVNYSFIDILNTHFCTKISQSELAGMSWWVRYRFHTECIQNNFEWIFENSSYKTEKLKSNWDLVNLRFNQLIRNDRNKKENSDWVKLLDKL